MIQIHIQMLLLNLKLRIQDFYYSYIINHFMPIFINSRQDIFFLLNHLVHNCQYLLVDYLFAYFYIYHKWEIFCFRSDQKSK